MEELQVYIEALNTSVKIEIRGRGKIKLEKELYAQVCEVEKKFKDIIAPAELKTNPRLDRFKYINEPTMVLWMCGLQNDGFAVEFANPIAVWLLDNGWEEIPCYGYMAGRQYRKKKEKK